MSDQPPGDLALVVRHTGRGFSLGPAGATIGRHPDNSIVIPDPQVSRHHAKISWQAGAYVIEDLGSGNGTFVNGKRISGPRLLAHGQVIGLGSVSLDVQQASVGRDRELPSAEPPVPARHRAASKAPRRLASPVIMGLLLGGFVIVCLAAAAVFWLLDLRNVDPTVSIQSPAPGTVVVVGSQVALQASAAGSRDINRLEMMVNGRLVVQATSDDPDGGPSLIAEGAWAATEAGTHIVAAVAYTAGNRASETVSIELRVVEALAQTTPAQTPAEVAGAPSGTASPSTPPVTVIPLPATSTAVAMTNTATSTPTPTETSAPTPTATEIPLPEIEYFRISPDTITVGECAVLEWGAVSGAYNATIEPDIGGVATPGSQQVCPLETTTYMLTAEGAGGIVSASASITVRAALPDLLVESVAFFPNPPVQGQNNEVRITFRNAGAGASGLFAWSWTPGASAPFTGNHSDGLGAGNSVAVSLVWQPVGSHTSLPTVARVDTGNAVTETDETNNELQVNVPVVEPSEISVVLLSQQHLDGYVPRIGSVVTGEEIRVGSDDPPPNEIGYRGFLSFDLSTIPTGTSVVRAELRFYQVTIQGNPFEHLRPFMLDHVDYGGQIDPLDYETFTLDSVELVPQESPGSWYVVSGNTITGWVVGDVKTGRSRFQVRLRFTQESDLDPGPDYLGLESGEGYLQTGNRPELIITYVP